MQPDQVASRILEMIVEIAEGVDLDDVDPDASLRDQFELDSVDFVDFVMLLRDRYGIEVPETDYHEFTTLNTSVAYLAPKFAGSPSS
jgi:acyl carrier protein